MILDEISATGSTDVAGRFHLVDNAFTRRMWRSRICCQGISKRLNFNGVGETLYSTSLLLGVLARSAESQTKRLQTRKELHRVQELGEDVIADNDNLSDVEPLQSAITRLTVETPRRSASDTSIPTIEWPDSDRARKRPRLSNLEDEEPASETFHQQLSRKLTLALCGNPVSDLDGLSKTAPTTFKRLSEPQQCKALSLMGQMACQLAAQTSSSSTCPACDEGILMERNTCSVTPELIKTIVAIGPSIARDSRARITAMTTLQRLLFHCASLDELRLGSSSAGEWCMHALRSSTRDLRAAAIATLSVFVLDVRADASLTRDNRIIVLDFLQALWAKNEPALQETAVLALTKIALLVGDEEMNIILLRLTEYLGHTNPYISGLVSEEIQQLAQARQVTTAILFRPFWRTLGPVIAKHLATRSVIIDQMCALLGMQRSGLMLLVEEYALPYLVVNQKHGTLHEFAASHGGSTTAFDICTSPRNLPGILSYLLTQGLTDPETKIMDLLANLSDDFGSEDLSGWLAHNPIQTACSLLKSIGDVAEGKSSRTHQALQVLAQLLLRKPGSHLSASKKSETMAVFLETNALAIVAHFTVLLNDLEAKEPKVEKKRCLAALGELVKLGKSRVIVALPQLCACLRSAFDEPDLCDVAFHSWGAMVSSLKEEDVRPLIDQTLAIILRSWDDFNTATQQYAYGIVSDLLKKHSSLVREAFETMPSLAAIPVMTKFESELGALKRQMDDRHQLMAFIDRVADENETVVEQALKELVPLLRSKQDLLHTSILREQPDVFVADLMRALLDCCVKFHTSTIITTFCGQALGSIGCLDHNKIENTVEQKTILVLSNFGKAEETVDFMIFFLENVLVKAFLSASTTRAQGFLAWAMQELLQLCDEEDRSGPRIRTGPSAAHRRWGDLPEAVRTTLTPFLTSKYRVQDARPSEKHEYPYFKSGMRHKDWLRAMVLDFLHRAPGNNVELIFGICCRIIQGQDASIPAFLLPYTVLNLIISGIQDDSNDVLNEILNILQQSLTQHDRKTQEDIRLCSQSIFEVMDYVQRWLQQRKKQYSNHISRQDRNVSDLALESASAEIRAVELMLGKIPPELLSQRAIECKSYSRALFHWEQYMRKSKSHRDNDLERLQEIYAQIDEPDGIEGISSHMHVVSTEGRVLEHKKAGRWHAAQNWYQMNLVAEPDNVDFQRNLMECLKESGQHDLLLDRYAGLGDRTISAIPQLTSYAIEASWNTFRLHEMASALARSTSDDFPFHLGQVMLALHQQETVKASALMDELYRATAAELTPSAITSFQNCHDTLLRLHVLDDVRLLSTTANEEKATTFSLLEKRLDVLGSNMQDKQYLLGVRRAIIAIEPQYGGVDMAGAWIVSARLARKARATNRAFDAVLKASVLGENAATLEEAKLTWQDGQHRKAIQALQGAIDSGAFAAHDFVPREQIEISVDSKPDQNDVLAKAYVLLGKWLDHAGQSQSDVIIKTFRKATMYHVQWEKGWYHLGRHYNKLLDSQRTLPVEKQSQNYLNGELATLVIGNFLRSLTSGSRYVFQTLPKILTLWFELVGGVVTPDTKRADKYHALLLSQRKSSVVAANKKITEYLSKVQPSILFTILPQVVARICHTDKDVYGILVMIVVRVVKAFPQQSLWTLLAVIKSQSKDRANRGLSIVQKVVDAQKKSSKEMSPPELRNMIQAGQRFSDEVLRVSEFPIEGKVSRVSLARDLGFNHKIAPSRLVVPAESCLIPNIPISHDQEYLKTFRAFAKEPITITAFLDEALVLASLQKPRKLSIRGSDGQIYGVLAKPKDDMRKDQRLMEFNTMINRFLKRDVEASKRRLSIRTYAVIPLSEECGLIEWVNNLKTFRDIILKLYKDKSITPNYGEIRSLLDQASAGDPEHISLFTTKVLKTFPPVFHEWFVESFPDPPAWFNARLRYIRSCAVMSFVGHVLGLGDRHGENILFEEDNGSLMHVDFNCLFDKGLTFEKPEYVPFRLTQNLVDAMGIYGYEGPFRRCSEITLTLLRSNEDALMTILETFLHDPTTDFIEKERRKKKNTNGAPNTPVEVLESVRGKVRGFLAGESVPLSVEGYVQEMIRRAVDERNLGRMYIGWCAFF